MLELIALFANNFHAVNEISIEKPPKVMEFIEDIAELATLLDDDDGSLTFNEGTPGNPESEGGTMHIHFENADGKFTYKSREHL